jgi:3',5'-cyclic AMP phosphodiesterase CpdA
MPQILHTPISRKTFIKTGLKYAGLLSSMGIFQQFAFAREDGEDLHLALLSDTHIKAYRREQYRGFFPYENLQQVVEEVTGVNPELLLINGDVARLEGQLGDYVAIQEILSDLSGIPIVMTLGNHDNRENFYNVLGEPAKGKQPVENKHVLVLDRSDLRIVLMDSLMYVNKTPGLLGMDQRKWLEAFLEETDRRPVFIFFHHTPYDGDGDLLDSDRFFDIIKPHKKVKAVFYGHSHVYNLSKRGHVQLINLPAVGYNFTDNQPVGWIEAHINAKKGTFLLHAIGGNQGKDGETREVTWT